MSIKVKEKSKENKKFDFKNYNVEIIGNRPFIRLNDKVDFDELFDILLDMLKHEGNEIALIEDFKHKLRCSIYKWREILSNYLYLLRNDKVLVYCNYFKLKYGELNSSVECIWETMNDLKLSIAVDLDFADEQIEYWFMNNKLPSSFSLNYLEDLKLLTAIRIDNYFVNSYMFNPKRYINYYGMKDLSK